MPPTVEKSFLSEELGVSLPVKVEGYLPDNHVWREISRIENVSETSANFRLTRAVEVGQLLLLKMPVKKNLRRYDLDKQLYRVWGVTRSCESAPDEASLALYRVGVALIGPEPPASFHEDPSTVYALKKPGKDGFWQIAEKRRGPENRRHPRYPIPIEVYIAIYDAQENIVAHEKTVTENISATGASVFSELQLKVGDAVRLIKQSGGFSANAIVRNRRIGSDNLPRLHLEFINGTFPLDGID